MWWIDDRERGVGDDRWMCVAVGEREQRMENLRADKELNFCGWHCTVLDRNFVLFAGNGDFY